MPQQAWSKKRERQYEHIKEGLVDRGRSEETAEEIAARTVNKERARSGESEQASRSSTDDISSGRRGGKRSHSGARGRTKAQLYKRGQAEGRQGPLHDVEGRAGEGGRPLSGSQDKLGSGHREDESRDQRIARNFDELLQELRVTQTGIQILTGFLLTVPFTERFPDLDSVQRNGYLTVLVGAVLATGFIIAPVALHRTLFRQGEKEWLVDAANWCARVGLVILAGTMSGVVWLVFDVVVSRTAALVAGGVAVAFFALLWAVLPMIKRGAA